MHFDTVFVKCTIYPFHTLKKEADHWTIALPVRKKRACDLSAPVAFRVQGGAIDFLHNTEHASKGCQLSFVYVWIRF